MKRPRKPRKPLQYFIRLNTEIFFIGNSVQDILDRLPNIPPNDLILESDNDNYQMLVNYTVNIKNENYYIELLKYEDDMKTFDEKIKKYNSFHSGRKKAALLKQMKEIEKKLLKLM